MPISKKVIKPQTKTVLKMKQSYKVTPPYHFFLLSFNRRAYRERSKYHFDCVRGINTHK